MGKHLIATAVCSAFGLIEMSGVALADTICLYECSVIGALAQEPIGDRNEHTMVSVQYSCVGMDGLLKGAVNTGISISEWDGPRGRIWPPSAFTGRPGGSQLGSCWRVRAPSS